MKSITRTLTFGTAVLVSGIFSTTHQAQAAAFSAGDLVVERVGGTGAYGGAGAAHTSAATAVFVDEFNSATATQAAPVQTFSMPAATTQPVPAGTAPNTVQLNLTDSGSATSDGFLNLSADRSTVTLGGYNATVGTAGVANSAATTNQRVVGLISAAGIVDTTTYSTTANTGSGGNFRSVIGVTGAGAFYSSGAGTNGGTNYFPAASGITSTNIGTTNPSGTAITNTRVNEIFTVGSTQSLYFSTGSGTAGIYTYGGLPTTTGATATLLVADASPYGFSVSPDGRTIYVANDSAGIRKYTSADGTAFTLASTFATVSRGLTVDYSGANPILYATSVGTATGNSLFTITDTGSLANATATTLATSPTNTFFRGVDFAPVAVPEPTTVLGGVLSVLALTWSQRRRVKAIFGGRLA